MSEEQNTNVAESQNGETVQSTNETVVTPIAVKADYVAVPVTIQSMLKAGAHFGHRTDRWNPKMLPYIYTQKSNVHIINLDMTIQLWEKARKFILDISSRGGTVLFVGTKPQASLTIKTAASRCGAHYVNHRWLGGMLSNFETIKKSLRRMKKMEELLEKAADENSGVKLAKKEQLDMRRQLEKLEANLGGIKTMRKHPDVLFIFDVNKESIAVSEARKLHIPVVALVDTNVDPKHVNFPIPANDDAARTIELFANAVADAVLEGKSSYQQRLDSDSREKTDVKSGASAKKSDESTAIGSVVEGVSA